MSIPADELCDWLDVAVRVWMGHARIRRVPAQIKCKLRAARARTICKYSRNPWCRLAFDGIVLALTANEITPPLTGRFRPEAVSPGSLKYN